MKSIFCTIAIAALMLVVVVPPRAAYAGLVYDTPLASPSTNPADSGFYNGTGNPNTNFVANTSGDVEFGVGVNNRFIGPVVPQTNSSIYNVATGFSSGLIGKWNAEFSIDLRTNGVGSLTLADVFATLSLTDVLAGTTMSFNPLLIPDNAGWGSSGKNVAALNPTDWGAQNSENFSFSGIKALLDPTFDPNKNDTYILKLSAACLPTVDRVCGDLGSVTETIIAGEGAPSSVPEPGTFVLFGTTLIALFGFRLWNQHHRSSRSFAVMA